MSEQKYTRLGHDLQQARKAKGLSLRQLARQVGVEHQRIILWEKGANRPRQMYRYLLEARLRTKFDWSEDVDPMTEQEAGAVERTERRIEEMVA